MSGIGKIFLLIAGMWLIQLGLAFRQAKKFEGSLKGLRKLGTVATGVGGRRYRGGRAFVSLAADEKGVVVAGLILSGFTIFSKAKPVNQFIGFSLDDVITGKPVVADAKPKVVEAAKMAAEHIKGHMQRSNEGE
jgi:DNA-binding transcriptional regulator of glucitol operon